MPIEDVDWEKRGTMKPSQIDPQTLVTLKHEWVVRHTGRVAHRPLARARRLIQSYLTAAKR